MIVRHWTAVALEENAEECRQYFLQVMTPRFRSISGFMGFTVLERVEHGRVEFLLMTRWDNMDAIRAYAGHKAEHAVVEPEAQALLDRFDQHAKHYVVALEESR